MTGMGNPLGSNLSDPNQAVPLPGDTRSLKSGRDHAAPELRAAKQPGPLRRLVDKLIRKG